MPYRYPPTSMAVHRVVSTNTGMNLTFAIAPAGAVAADLTLYYQGTSWEYVQFLNNAVSSTTTGAGAPNPVTPFLADEGKNYLDAWVNADQAFGAMGPMVPPYTMAIATWGQTQCVPVPEVCDNATDDDCDGIVDCDDRTAPATRPVRTLSNGPIVSMDWTMTLTA